MGWPPPAGLKLNAELNGFLGQLFLWVLQVWTGEKNLKNTNLLIWCADTLSLAFEGNTLAAIFETIGFCGHFGATFIISLLSDLLNITTLHLHLFYVISAKFYNWEINVLFSFFNLFRGNILFN